MKKILIFVLLIVVSFGIFETPESYGYFRVEETTKETTYSEGVRHTEIVGQINNDGTITDQVINYLGANMVQNSDLNIVVGDNFYSHQDDNDKWGMFNILGLIENIENRYDNFDVIAGVNGDFYDINDTGRPIAVYIRNYEVINPVGGYSTRPVVGFKDDGSTVYGVPQFNGYELLVYNDEGQLKDRRTVDHINSDPTSDDEISVYFDNYLNALPNSYTKVFIDGEDTKIVESNGSYFGTGAFNKETTLQDDILEHQFVIVGEGFNEDDLITETDRVVVQMDVVGDFEGVRSAIGVDAQPLVIAGEANINLNAGAAWNYPAPRTAVGVKADGTTFFVVVDGRNKPLGMDGVTLQEMGHIMAYFGAESAYNLDGGGSSTMTLKDLESGEYMILNTPSDGRLRSISNGLFIVKGEHESIPDPIPSWPDTRDALNQPENVYVRDGILHFNAVTGAAGYDVKINGEVVTVEDHMYTLDLDEGIYDISVRAKGGTLYQSSGFTEGFLLEIYPNDIYGLIDMIKAIAKG